MTRLSTMAAAMSFDEMRDSLPPFGGAPPFCGDQDGVVELSRVDSNWDEARYARHQSLQNALRATTSRDSSTFGDGSDYEELLRLDEDNVKRGLSANAIRRLRRRNISSREKIEDPITKCVVPAGTNVFDLPCGHCFEKPTLLTWFERHRTCPVCRHELEP